MSDLTYAIGDVHGCLDKLERLLAAIEEHRAGRPRRLVFLGDYIDRGPASAGVLARVRALQLIEPETVVCLRGNHAQMLLDAARTNDDALYELWVMNGGEEALESFVAMWSDGMDPEMLAWVGGLPLMHQDERRFYVHAGFDPARPAPQDDPKTCLWIRDPFLSTEHDFGKHVVHGHTPQESGLPQLLAWRTNLDTAAVFGGPLTAGVFADEQGPPVGFIQVDRGGAVRSSPGA